MTYIFFSGCESSRVLVIVGYVPDEGLVCFGDLVGYLNAMMETKGGKSSKQYESPLGYVVEDVRPRGGSEKFRTAAYSNCCRKPS